jgi:hypothetical protein
MDVLLNIIDHALLEIIRIVGEQTDAGRRFVDDELVTGADGPGEVLSYQLDDAGIVCILNTAKLFTIPSPFVAFRATPETPPNQQMRPAKGSPAERAKRAGRKVDQAFAAFGSFGRDWVPVHRFSNRG